MTFVLGSAPQCRDDKQYGERQKKHCADLIAFFQERKKAEKEKEEKEKDFYRIERRYGSFQRTLSLPEDVDQDGIGAGFKDGVLTVTMPRKEVAKDAVKTIEITAMP